ncbi:MAG: response regulator [Candidatus Omnitrophica bacterium]|nr:response regulator [Candidatus Omnitrophota bacterium]
MASVYVIDDSKFIRDRLSRNLMEKIKTVRLKTAEDFNDVKVGMVDFSPDVIIVDIQLKEGTGFDVLRYIRETGIKPFIVVLTNYSIQPYREKALDLGADYFFDKSNEFHKAIDVIEKHVTT